MSLLRAEHLWKNFSAEPTLADVSLDIRSGDRLALVGPNGCGKTTLLRILAGELEPDRGVVVRRKNLLVGHLRQSHAADPAQSVWDFAHTALEPLHRLAAESEQLAAALSEATDHQSHDALARKFDQVQRELQQADAFQLDYKVERILGGLGFDPKQYRQPLGTLSGGQINRLMLAHLLISGPDVMLLDEPSNHLDMHATEWLEDFLREASGAFVIVSHDRYLLDRVTDQTIELIDGRTESFPGSYSRYVRLKSERLELQRRTYEKQRQEIDKLEDFIRRNHYGQKAAQAEDRRKKLAQIELVDRPRSVEAPPMSFGPVERSGDVVLRVQRLGKSFDRPLFSDLSFQIERGQRWGILGKNGSGKSTILRCLIEPGFSFEGQVKWGTGVQIGYFDQHLRCVAHDVTPTEAIRPLDRDLIDQARRDLLAKFGILGETALQPVHRLSGGQRNRVALARLAASAANTLVMDEPTNHLDLWSRESLASALSRFEGTVLVVSHDRYFLNQLCDHLIVLDDERARVFEGNYDTYRRLAANQSPFVEGAKRAAKSELARTSLEPSRPKRRFPYRRAAEIEAEIAEREARVKQLESELCDPAVLRSRERVLETRSRLDFEVEQIQKLYEHLHEAGE